LFFDFHVRFAVMLLVSGNYAPMQQRDLEH
jgi:hypothetical protein